MACCKEWYTPYTRISIRQSLAAPTEKQQLHALLRTLLSGQQQAGMMYCSLSPTFFWWFRFFSQNKLVPKHTAPRCTTKTRIRPKLFSVLEGACKQAKQVKLSLPAPSLCHAMHHCIPNQKHTQHSLKKHVLLEKHGYNKHMSTKGPGNKQQKLRCTPPRSARRAPLLHVCSRWMHAYTCTATTATINPNKAVHTQMDCAASHTISMFGQALEKLAAKLHPLAQRNWARTQHRTQPGPTQGQ
jgi:hypothetical protein